MRRFVFPAAVTIVLMVAAPALACGGLVNPNGSISLLRTSTLAAYVDGVEHYITSFEFAGGGGEFGSIVPLPGIPSKVERAGDWTLQRLQQEVAPPVAERLSFSADSAAVAQAKVLLEVQIDALDITILEGGGDSVGEWALDNGFALTPDSPEVLNFYADRSPIFMAARFDAKEAAKRGQSIGDGTPIHLAIPTTNPWVPLRILGLGLGEKAAVEADVFLLTERKPALLPVPEKGLAEGLIEERSEAASELLLSDLASDKGMDWLPTDDMWLTYLQVRDKAGDLTYDLAIDASGMRQPSALAAGLIAPDFDKPAPADSAQAWPLVFASIIALVLTVRIFARPPASLGV